MKPLSNYPELLRLLEKYSPIGQNYAELILDIEKKSQSSDLIVPILGTQGMGKSTMINAILNEDILPNEADETTCVPVEVRYGLDPHGEVFFFGGKDSVKNSVVVNTKADLSEYVDNNFNSGNEKQVDHIVLYRNHPLLKTGLVIVDLPGVGSLTKANEETTNHYIKNLCIAVFIISTSPPILKTEANFITTVWRNFNSAYFVQNVWDDNTESEVQDGLAHNNRILNEISQKINAPMLHPIIPVNAYAAAKGAFEHNLDLINSSNIKDLFSTLEAFASDYRQQSSIALEARVQQFITSATEQVDSRIQSAHLTSDELLAAMEKEEKNFEQANEEITDIVDSIKRQLNKDHRDIQVFASETARNYTELLRVELFRLIDKGVVDGDLLSNAFSEYQSQYATDALDVVYERFEQLAENLKSKLEMLDSVLEREELNSPNARGFNKAQAFKWEKGMDATISLGSAIGGFFAGAAIGGPLGIAACIGISLIGGLIGNKSRKSVVKARGYETKHELEPYIASFKSDLNKAIVSSHDQFAAEVLKTLNDYVSSREKQLNAIKQHIDEFRENGSMVKIKLEELMADKKYLTSWRADND